MIVEDVLKVMRSHLPELRELGVQRIGVFGSTATGTATPGSDIDVKDTDAHVMKDSEAQVGDLMGKILEAGMKEASNDK